MTPGVISSALGLSAFSMCLALVVDLLLLAPAIGVGCLVVVGGEDLGPDTSQLEP